MVEDWDCSIFDETSLLTNCDPDDPSGPQRSVTGSEDRIEYVSFNISALGMDCTRESS